MSTIVVRRGNLMDFGTIVVLVIGGILLALVQRQFIPSHDPKAEDYPALNARKKLSNNRKTITPLSDV